ncbi:MAG: hypothetical protein HP492_04735 [Nitrospira sp.]|nr:hypothetical protein [Nitrospira sp.]
MSKYTTDRLIEFDQFLFQLAPADFFEDGCDSIGHLRLFDFSLLQERDRGRSDRNQLPADGADDSIVLIGEQANQGADLAFWNDHRSSSYPVSCYTEERIAYGA